MRKIILRDGRKIPPFNEPARELSVLTKPLWLHQRDVLAKYTTEEGVIDTQVGLSYATNRTNLQLRLGLENAQDAQSDSDSNLVVPETTESDMERFIER